MIATSRDVTVCFVYDGRLLQIVAAVMSWIRLGFAPPLCGLI